MPHDVFAAGDARPSAIAEPSATVLQALLWPEPGIITEHALFYRLGGKSAFNDAGNDIQFEPGGHASFDTAANLFNIGKWWRSTGIEDLRLHLRGAGRFELVVFQVLPERSWEQLAHRVVTLAPDCEIDLSHFRRLKVAGLLYFTLTALEAGHLAGASWITRQPPRRLPRIALSITTFRREAAVRRTVERFDDFMARSPLAGYLHLIVVDNGQSAGIAPRPHVTPIANENLGGSGGFARGLTEAEARGFTHCIFMDDDASITLGAVERVWAFLAYALDEGTAVSGGLAMANHRWSIWENGATFDRRCRPQWLGTDMRDFGQITHMEIATTRRSPDNFYGGWWFFAFPIAGLRYRPFPFFVRGDDVSFSIANGFDIVTLPGVICFQDEDFADKESLQTLYLDLRSHLVHHLALPGLDIGRKATVGIAFDFFMRSLLQCHYETLEALNLAVEDVMQGPAFFAANADMSARRSALSAIRKVESWQPLAGDPPPARFRVNLHGPGFRARLWRRLLNLSLNGYLLPFFGRWGNEVTLRSGQRGDVGAHWGAARITYVSADGTKTFTVRHSKRVALPQVLRMIRNLRTLSRRYDRIKADWRTGYDALATQGFWAQQFAATDGPADPETGGSR
ncbi:glycosyltransferase [Paragemmobacter ruber]|uniref:Glycosyltransferase n=1 Tax=Paragemmobacter ruber TaxID=1985673 RepID=A0ABW9Y200_9RHOB|nr:glycosyltransferase [Rhodobacter ruber]NBE06432.1 glycosyltransferase [Rhodobacter ruber]